MKRALTLLSGLLALVCWLSATWLGTSLAAFTAAPLWPVLLVALLLFPVLPLLWALIARRHTGRAGLLGATLVRALPLNLLVALALLVALPGATAAALATQGDWMLPPDSAPLSAALHRVADGLAPLHRATLESLVRRPDALPGPPPSQVGPPLERWPLPRAVHPAVASMAAADEADIASVANHIVRREDDSFGRVRALHDYAAQRLQLDLDALRSGRLGPQDAEAVFRTRRAVSQGFANLFAALARAAGIRVATITGRARDLGGRLEGMPHVWNAVQIEGRWYLVDVVWDAGHLRQSRFVPQLDTLYLFTPPAFFAADHLPDDPAWQLLPNPRTWGDFMRQPLLSPRFHALGLDDLRPRRSPPRLRR